MAADSGMKNIIALKPNVGESGGCQCGRRITRCSVFRETCVWKMEDNKIRTKREKERGTKRYMSIIKSMCNSYK